MKNFTLIKRILICAALLLNVGGALRVSAQAAPARPEATKPAPRFTVYIGGAIKEAGPVQLAADSTLADLFAQAKGWTKDADLTKVRITRRVKISGKEKITTQVVNFEDYANAKQGQVPDEANNPVVQD